MLMFLIQIVNHGFYLKTAIVKKLQMKLINAFWCFKVCKNTNNALNNEIDTKNRDGSTIEIKFSLENKRAFALINNEEIGESTFSPSDKLWIIDHTDVNRDFKGQNIGEKLINAIVSQARGLNIKILALCPFAKHLMTKDDSYKDVLN